MCVKFYVYIMFFLKKFKICVYYSERCGSKVVDDHFWLIGHVYALKMSVIPLIIKLSLCFYLFQCIYLKLKYIYL